MKWATIRGASSSFFVFPMAVEYDLTNDDSFGRYDVLRVNDDVDETSFYNIDKLTLRDVGAPFVTFGSILQAATSQSYTPKLLWSYPESYSESRRHQGWVWQQDGGSFDVFVARSAATGYTPQLVKFNPRSADASLPNIWLALPADKKYGFVRLTGSGNSWSITSGYNVGLTTTTAPPVTASLTGPACIKESTNGVFRAYAGGGLPPWTYNWYYLYTCGAASMSPLSRPLDGINAPPCNSWTPAGIGQEIAFGAGMDRDFEIKVSIKDANGTTAVSPAQFVDVRTLAEGPCYDEPLASTGESAVGAGSLSGVTSDARSAAAQTPHWASSVEDALESPTRFALYGNYPNPFNPTTEIRFDLPESVQVRLMVYDLMGREVARLVDGPMAAGRHAATFEAKDLPSGTYLYRLTAGRYTRTGRMVLLK